MKPKEIIYQSGIVNGVNARNQDYFLDLMMTELKNTKHRLASYYYPSPKKILGDKCEMFLDIKNY